MPTPVLPSTRAPSRRRMVAAVLLATLAMLATACATGGAGSASGTPGVTDDRVLLGTSSDLTGPAGAFGVAFKRGTDAWFQHVNETGGVHGRTIEYRVLDDGLDVARAITNTRSLIAEPVFAVVGGNGAGSIVPIAQLLDQQDVPYLYPPTGKPEFATNVLPHVFAMVPTFSDQLDALITWSAGEMGSGSVFHLVADTTDIEQQVKAAEAAAKRVGGSWLGHAVVPIGAGDITPFALQAAQGAPDYIALTTGPADAIKIVNYLASVGKLPKKAFLDVTPHPGRPFLSGVTSPEARGLVRAVAPTVPPTDPAAASCNAALQRYYPDQQPDAQTLFGCAVAQATVTALDSAGPDLTRDGLVQTLESMKDVRVSEVLPPVTYGPDRHMGATALPLVRIDGNEFTVQTNVTIPGARR